jgi:hypothetical protein
VLLKICMFMSLRRRRQDVICNGSEKVKTALLPVKVSEI